jgi:multidrug resistance efflux pump
MTSNEKQVKALTGKVGRLLDIMATVENPAPYQRRIAEMEAERAGLVAELSRQQAQADLEKTAVQISKADVRGALRGLLDDLRAKEGNVAELRAALASQIDRVELDPESERCVIHYRLTTGVNLASPRRPELIPRVAVVTEFKVA